MNDIVDDRLGGLLERLSPPRSMLKNEQAQLSEIRALAKVIRAYIPRTGQHEWFDDLEDAVFENLQTRAWPTVFEIKKAIKQITKYKPSEAKDDWKPDSMSIAADKIRSGEPVGDAWLYGEQSLKLRDAYGIGDDELAPYRDALFYSAREFAGHAYAAGIQRNLMMRHDEALHYRGEPQVWDTFAEVKDAD